MGLDYPSGPQIDKLAKEGNPYKFQFPTPNMKGYDVSYSGVKTAFTNFIHKQSSKNKSFISDNLNDLCASLQYTLVQIILNKIEEVVKAYELNQIVIGGGVAANSELRNQLAARAESEQWQVFLPPLKYTTDNAAMIGIAAYFKLQNQEFGSLSDASLSRLNY
jgi:N6-L-threonylcarbamoyladenine synthase